MYNLKKFNIDDKNIMFINNSRNTRSGFAHDTEFYINDRYINENTCIYYNRTWECYRYQSVMMGAIYNEIESRKNDIKSEYKNDNKISRLTKKHAEKVNDIIINDDYIKLLQAIQSKLREY